MDGIDAFDEMKKHGLKVPVIAQTAYAFSDEIRKIKAAGFDGYLSKPINSAELYKLLNKFF
jgi:CheY-like chemotaxis protein